MTRDEINKKIYEVSQIFTPSTPVDQYSLFAGRQKQVQKIIRAIGQKGQHVVIYGERGVGKTSLANVLDELLELVAESGELVVRVNADTNSSLASLWRSVLREIPSKSLRTLPGFATRTEVVDDGSLSEIIGPSVAPEEIRHLLQTLDTKLVVIFDEFDRVKNKRVTAAISDTIKTLSDHAVAVTVVIVGVANSVSDLVQNHPSIERSIVQVQMPRMSSAELQEIVMKGLEQAAMTIEPDGLDRIARLSQGLPHYTHLLGLNAATEALNQQSLNITLGHVRAATIQAVEQAEQSVRSAYHSAVMSSRGYLYPQVLLACALAEVDELGYFKASAVMAPMKRITGRDYNIAAFARHLKDFCSNNRGPIIEKAGSRGRFRYRIINPTMQPYIVMKGLADGMIEEELWDQF